MRGTWHRPVDPGTLHIIKNSMLVPDRVCVPRRSASQFIDWCDPLPMYVRTYATPDGLNSVATPEQWNLFRGCQPRHLQSWQALRI